MELGALLVGLAILVLAGAYMLRPLVEPRPAGAATAEPRVSALQAERDRVLDRLREIDMDHAMGKIPPDEYQPQRAELAAYGAHVLRKLDELGSLAPADVGDGQRLEAELEASVARLRQAPQVHARFCPHCGMEAVEGDRFCSHCGHSLALAEPTA